MSLWESLKSTWKTWNRTEYTGPTLTDDEIVQRLAENMGAVILSHGKPFVRQAVIEAGKADLDAAYWPYLFWTIENHKHWPEMTESAKAGLTVGRTIMLRSGAAPNHAGNLVLPPSDQEKAVDATLARLGWWAASAMNGSLIEKYDELLHKWDKPMEVATAGRLSPTKSMVYLKALFEAELERNPNIFKHGHLLDECFHLLLF